MPDRRNLEHHLALELHRLVVASGKVAHRYAARSALNTTDLMAMLHLWEAGLGDRTLTASELADRLDVTPAAVTYLVDRLVDQGYLERVRNPDDRRQVLLQISARGHHLSGEFVQPQDSWYSRALARHSDADLVRFTSMVAELGAALTHLAIEESKGGTQDD